MILYTCGQKGSGPAALHPCAKAVKALDDAGLSYELRTVGGYKLLPWTRRGQRDEIRTLTGQSDVPVLVTDDGAAINGSGRIAAWAREHGSA